jgi:hypothetical protein
MIMTDRGSHLPRTRSRPMSSSDPLGAQPPGRGRARGRGWLPMAADDWFPGAAGAGIRPPPLAPGLLEQACRPRPCPGAVLEQACGPCPPLPRPGAGLPPSPLRPLARDGAVAVAGSCMRWHRYLRHGACNGWVTCAAGPRRWWRCCRRAKCLRVGEVRLLDHGTRDLFGEAVFALEAVVEANQVAVRVLRLDSEHRGGDNVLFDFTDAGAAMFDGVLTVLSVDGCVVGVWCGDIGEIRRMFSTLA